MLLGIILFTGIEVVTLVSWLLLSSTIIILSQVVLFLGFDLEHIVAYNTVNKRHLLKLSGTPIIKIATISAIETIIWDVWLIISMFNEILGSIFLIIFLIPEHTISDNAFRNKPLFEKLISVKTIGFSIVEGIGASVWLRFVNTGLHVLGIAVLAVTSFIEHKMAVSIAKRG